MIALMIYKYEYENNYLCHLTESITITYLQQNVMWYLAKSCFVKSDFRALQKTHPSIEIESLCK